MEAKLIDPSNGSQLWTGNYNGNVSDILMMRQTVEKEILKVLHITLSQSEQDRLVRPTADDAEAYRLSLQGRYAWLRRTIPDAKRAIELFNQAIETQPDYALAYAGLAETYLGGIGLRPREVIPKAKAAATRALEIDPALAEAHTAM